MSRALAVAALLAACSSSGPPACTLDDRKVDVCAFARDGAAILVEVIAAHESLVFSTPDGDLGTTALPGNSTLERNAGGTTCDAVDGRASWREDGSGWYLQAHYTCGAEWHDQALFVPSLLSRSP